MYQPELERKNSQDPLLSKLTPEEILILKKCNSEATMNRGIPFGLLGGGAVFLGIKNGFIKAKSRNHAIVAVSLTTFMSFILGRMSYVISCVNASLPKSTFERLNKQILITKDSNVQEKWEQNAQRAQDDSNARQRHDGISLDVPSSDFYDSNSQSHSYEADTKSERNPSYRNTYDDLREQNRKYNQQESTRQPDIYKPSSTTSFFWDEPTRYGDEPKQDFPAPEEKPKARRKTKYGDEFD